MLLLLVIVILSTAISHVIVSHFSCLHDSSFASLILFSHTSMKTSLLLHSYLQTLQLENLSYIPLPFTEIFDVKFQMLEILSYKKWQIELL